jgi:hypothetical protein
VLYSGEAKNTYEAEFSTGFGRKTIQRHMDINTHDACQSLDTFRPVKVERQKDIPSPVAAIMRARVGQGGMEQGTLVHFPQVKSSSSNIGGFDPNAVDGGFNPALHEELAQHSEGAFYVQVEVSVRQNHP